MTVAVQGTATMITGVRNGLIPVEPFQGVREAAVTTESRGPRWLELTLYRQVLDDGQPGDWMVHSVGKTVVYHKADSDCNAGVPAGVTELPEDAEPCRTCRPVPMRLLGDDATVDLESDRHTAYRCTDPWEVMEKLQGPPHISNGHLSGPAQRLLERAARVDTDIRDALRTPGRL